MNFFKWWNEPGSINQSIAKGLISGTLIGSVLFAGISIAFDQLVEKSPSDICRESNTFGSSAWVACVDKLIQEARP
jgi:hypothetical protein